MAAVIPTGFNALPLPIVQLSLAAVLKCGQSFRWYTFPLSSESTSNTTLNTSDPGYEYRLCLRDRVVCLQQSHDTLFYRSVFPTTPISPTDAALREAGTLTWLKDYFQLDVDLVKLYTQWSERDPVFKSFRSRFSGIRMLRQDPWENLLSFICSSNNNISRITKMVQSLCKHFSPPLMSLPDPIISSSSGELNNQAYYPFPPPSALAAPNVASTLRSLGFGYRAEFIQRTAEMLVGTHGISTTPQDSSQASEKWLRSLRDVSIVEAREELLKFVGVGRKVADCVLLMSLDKREVIPIDTHVHQIAIKYYGLRSNSKGKTTMTPKLYEELSTKLVNIWGDYAGWAHSVMFTADLKSFSSYGLVTPLSVLQTPVKQDHPIQRPFTPPLTPSPSPLKRKVGTSSSGLSSVEKDGPVEVTTLGERVKRRRRNLT